MPLLLLPSELLIQIGEYVADNDVEANGDIVAFAETCRLLRSLSEKVLQEFLDEEHQYRHVKLHGRSELMMDLLLGIQLGSRARWHVRTLEVKGLENNWQHSEHETPRQYRILRDIVSMRPLLTPFHSLQDELFREMWAGADTALLALLLSYLPRLQLIKPDWSADQFLRYQFIRAAEAGIDWTILYPVLSNMERVHVGWRLDGADQSSGESIAFIAGHASSSSLALRGHREAPPSSMARVFSLNLEQTKLEADKLSTFLRHFTSLTSFRCKASRFSINWDPSAIRETLEQHLHSTLLDISMTADLTQPDRLVGSFRNFHTLECLNLDLAMFVNEDTQITQPFSAILPTSLKTLDIWNCFVQGSVSNSLEDLLAAFEPTMFPLLRRITFHTIVIKHDSKKHILDLEAALHSGKVPCSRHQYECSLAGHPRTHQGLVIGVALTGRVTEEFHYFKIGDNNNNERWCDNQKG